MSDPAIPVPVPVETPPGVPPPPPVSQTSELAALGDVAKLLDPNALITGNRPDGTPATPAPAAPKPPEAQDDMGRVRENNLHAELRIARRDAKAAKEQLAALAAEVAALKASPAASGDVRSIVAERVRTSGKPWAAVMSALVDECDLSTSPAAPSSELATLRAEIEALRTERTAATTAEESRAKISEWQASVTTEAKAGAATYPTIARLPESRLREEAVTLARRAFEAYGRMPTNAQLLAGLESHFAEEARLLSGGAAPPKPAPSVSLSTTDASRGAGERDWNTASHDERLRGAAELFAAVR